MFEKYLRSKYNNFIKRKKAAERNKLVQTEEQLTEAEEQRQKELLQQYGHKFQSSGDANFRGVSCGENNEIVYKTKRASLQLFPLTIQEEADVFDSIPTPSRNESINEDIPKLHMMSSKKPKESKFQHTQKIENSQEVSFQTDSKPQTGRTKNKKTRIRKKMSSMNAGSDYKTKKSQNLSPQRRKTRIITKENSQNISLFSMGLDSSKGNNSSEGDSRVVRVPYDSPESKNNQNYMKITEDGDYFS